MVIAPDVPEYLPLFTGNPDEPPQVFQNLISNAVNYDSAKSLSGWRWMRGFLYQAQKLRRFRIGHQFGRRDSAENIPRLTARFYCVNKGRPFVLRVGMKGASNAHSRSVISLAWRPQRHS